SCVRLLVVDGFFDFTPVQGEILKLLIPQAAEVIVNLNRDESNPEIFRPFERTVNQLASIANFEILESDEALPVAPGLSPLRGRLFNPNNNEQRNEMDADVSPDASLDISLLDCGN